MKTIEDNVIYELIIKNSRFITLLIKINNQTELESIITSVKEKYPDANHYCYGYIINNYKKSSDDGEPSGTAGIPILKVLEANNLSNVLAIVVRYFGGIKLGANGLIRAYTKAISNAIKETNLKSLMKGFNVNITFNYEDIKKIDYLLKDVTINNKSFNESIIYNIDIENLSLLDNNKIKYNIIKEINIEK